MEEASFQRSQESKRCFFFFFFFSFLSFCMYRYQRNKNIAFVLVKAIKSLENPLVILLLIIVYNYSRHSDNLSRLLIINSKITYLVDIILLNFKKI